MKNIPQDIENDESVKLTLDNFWNDPQKILALIDLLFLNDDKPTIPS